MDQNKPTLLILDDWEGKISAAPAMAKLRSMADVRILDRPLSELPDDEIRDARFIMAIRERTKIDRNLLDRLPRLELILQTGGHAYHIDVDEAAERGITVTLWRQHEACEAAVRELTIGLMIAALRRLPEAVRSADRGEWPLLLGATLKGRRLGILGMGLQGQAVAKLGQAFDMDVVALARPGSTRNADGGVPRLPINELLATSDVVSVHLRLSEESRGYLSAARLQAMKPGSVLVNTARGAIVDQEALADVLRHGPLGAAGLDVFTDEPLPAESPLRSLQNVVLTPHIGWTVTEAFEEFTEGAAGQLEDYLAGNLSEKELAFKPRPRKIEGRLGGVVSV